MKGIILYTSKTGVTEDIAKQIQKESTFDLDLVKLKKKMDTVDFQNYDFIIIGTPTYVSRSPKIMRDFVLSNSTSLLSRPLFVFTVGGEPNVDLEISLPLSFPKEVVSNIKIKKYLGGEFRFDKMKGISRFILKAVQKNKEKTNPGQGNPTILYESITQFCLDLDAMVH